MIPESIRAVLFDVYGTLVDGPRHPDRDARIAEVARRFGLAPRTAAGGRWDELVRRFHAQSPEPFPEMDAAQVWRGIFPGLSESRADAFALAVEEAIHPVCPTPWAETLLEAAAARQRPLGIVSNAQAYTKTLLDRYFPETFEPELCAFSYQLRIAKPDPRLFEKALRPLLRRGLQPAEILMVGDSPALDGAPAKALGLPFLRVGGDAAPGPIQPPDRRDPRQWKW
jgi:HAD superfamily hydrolase (TIGR01549 family)